MASTRQAPGTTRETEPARQASSRGRARGRGPTLKDVAAAAGVSLSTASLVFSRRGPVAEHTRGKVLLAAEGLGYSGPDPLASSLRRGRSGIVAVVVEGRLSYALRDPYAVGVLDGLVSTLDTAGAGILLVPQDPTEPGRAESRLAASGLDAVVLLGCGRLDPGLRDALNARGLPLVTLGGLTLPEVVRVDIDHRTAMQGIAEHLRGLGHTAVGCVTLPYGHPVEAPSLVSLTTLIERTAYDECRDRLSGLGDVFEDVPCIAAQEMDVTSGAEAARILLDAHPELTAIVAQSDLLASGVARAAEQRGLRVPDDLSVTGFDGVPTPAWDGVLTTVVQPSVDKGATAARVVSELVEGRSADSVFMPTQLRVGTSTGPARHTA